MKKTLISTILATVVLSASLAGCSGDPQPAAKGSASAAHAAVSYSASSQSGATTMSANATSYSAGAQEMAEDAYYDVAFEYNPDLDEMSQDQMERDVSSKEYNQTGISGADTKVDLKKEMLVYRCSIALDTLEFEQTVAALKMKIAEYHGFLENEKLSDGSYSNGRYVIDENSKDYLYTATIRVPSSYYESFVSSTEGLGILRSKNSSVDNVATQYGTLKNQLEIYEAQYDRYMKQYENTEDENIALKIQGELRGLAVTISDIKTQMSMMENDVAYSYVSIKIHKVTEKEVVEEVEEEEEEEDTFSTRVSKAAKESWNDFTGFLEKVLMFFILNWWILIIVLIAAVVLFIIIKLLIKRSKKKHEQKIAEEKARIEERRRLREAEGSSGIINHYHAAKMKGSHGPAASSAKTEKPKEEKSEPAPETEETASETPKEEKSDEK